MAHDTLLIFNRSKVPKQGFMGCSSSKSDVPESAERDKLPDKEEKSAPSSPVKGNNDVAADGATPNLVRTASKLDAAEVRRDRLSVRYQAKELEGQRSSATLRRSNSSTPFEKAQIGIHTRIGVMPGPRGNANAKINQDRGALCWPFHGTLNEALLCVFDGHGPKGEKASEFCMVTLPEMLEADYASLKKECFALVSIVHNSGLRYIMHTQDPGGTLSRNIIQLDQMFLTGEHKSIAMSCGTTSNVLYMRGEPYNEVLNASQETSARHPNYTCPCLRIYAYRCLALLYVTSRHSYWPCPAIVCRTMVIKHFSSVGCSLRREIHSKHRSNCCQNSRSQAEAIRQDGRIDALQH